MTINEAVIGTRPSIGCVSSQHLVRDGWEIAVSYGHEVKLFYAYAMYVEKNKMEKVDLFDGTSKEINPNFIISTERINLVTIEGVNRNCGITFVEIYAVKLNCRIKFIDGASDDENSLLIHKAINHIKDDSQDN